ncbi:tetratricopeptide repeat protein [Oscillatoria sp. FACHB-1406]|nr:tetratricopeptide repeat protein [Oscillatoria sp. FACHB-1406]
MHAVYCINPDCNRRQNPAHLEFCQACETPLLIRKKYRLLHPLRALDSERSTEIFEVEVKGKRKVMKILKKSSPKLIELFQREALALESLDHPDIPAIELNGEFKITFKTGKVIYCLIMSKIEGENLEQYLERRGKIPYQTARRWTVDLLNLLDYIHKCGFLHRDLKPSNLMIQPDGRLAIVDFGSVKKITANNGFSFRGAPKSQPSSVTSIVSRGYTAPEQIYSKATLQSDFFALGRTLVYLLSGTPPNEFPIDPKTGKLIWRKRASRVPKLFAELIDDLMAPSPKDRPKDSETALKYLDNLWWRGIERFANSSRFKPIATASVFLTTGLAIASLIIYRTVFAPMQAKAYADRGQTALAQDTDNQLAVARHNFERAVQIDPNQSTFYNNLALICTIQKDFECAKKNYQKSLMLDKTPEQLSITYYKLGQLYEERQEFEVALNAYEISMKFPNVYGIQSKNSYAHLKIWQYGEAEVAIKLLKEVLVAAKGLEEESAGDTEKVVATTYQNIGWAYLQQGRYAEAKAALQEALSLEKSDSAAPYCLMAKVLQAEGEDREALKYWKTCRQNDAGKAPEVKTWQGDANQYLNFNKDS